MAEPRYVSFTPRWMQKDAAKIARLADTPNTGFEPEVAPRLPTRILPARGGSSLSANTLSEAIFCTQRILNYVSYEVVHGIQPDFADLRSADQAVIQLAKLSVEPFEEGSFFIPAALTEDTIEHGGSKYVAAQILSRFVEVMHTIDDPKSPASLGLVQAIEDLGKITKREADRIEYYPSGSHSGQTSAVVVDEVFIARVKKSKRERQSPTLIPDDLSGVITAVDIVRASFHLVIDNRTTVRGKFEGLIQDRMIRSLNEHVSVSGVVEYRNNHPKFIRAFSMEFLD